MDSLESKLDRLTPGQRREVDDFVDFLLQQSGSSTAASMPVSRQAPPPLSVAPPAFIVEDTSLPLPETSTPPVTGFARETGIPPHAPEPVVASSPIQEIVVSTDDYITRDYMDYGRFDQPAREPSPADAAVRKVKETLIRKSKEDRSRQLLDWID
ncbi:MAG: hypothetical protein PHF57_03575 [Methanoregula sp.]|nr:hypothetical protein [Methanoregula sp.]MDD5187268.1 hypothetical protein [Methanoregula sp.]